ncbi:Protein kinase protein rad53 [Exophiala xenobiotica]|nr:Protein kinase protein rad53 [Exophiala xenobiotica]
MALGRVRPFRWSVNLADDRYVKPSPISRGTTPSEYGEDETPSNELEYFHRIQLRFNQETKVKGRVTFGSDPDLCDVLIESTRPRFYISFDSEQRPAIWDDSNNGLIVSYDGQGKNDLRNHFKWIFFPEFMAKAPPPHEVAFHNLILRSQGTSFAPSESLSPTRRPVYLKREELGEGAFERVRKVLDATTGDEYAGKEFFHKNGWEKEVEIMKYLRHPHIVLFVDSRTTPNPFIVMEYLPLGNLAAQDQVSSVSDTDMLVICNQTLEGLSYLHSQNITHRDLKPENILLRSRTPIHIKLADFGLAQDGSDLKTFCGSRMYAAPEIFLGQHYTNAVDIWSLGVIVMKFVYGLPQHGSAKRKGKAKQKETLRSEGVSWCRSLIESADDWESDPLIDFLTMHMLKWNPQQRLSAAECLNTASEINLFSESIAQKGDLTPRLHPVHGTDDIDIEEASTIIRPLSHMETLAQNVHASRSEGSMLRSAGPSPPLIPRDDERTSSVFREQPDTRSAKRRRTVNDTEQVELPQPPTEGFIWDNRGATLQINEINEMTDSTIDRLLHVSQSSLKCMTPSHSRTDDPDMNNTKVQARWHPVLPLASSHDHQERQTPRQPPALQELQTQGLPLQIHHTANIFKVCLDNAEVAVRKKDLKVNVSNLMKFVSMDIEKYVQQRPNLEFERVRGSGSYIDFQDAIEIWTIEL